MSIRFAAPPSSFRNRIEPSELRENYGLAANDNAPRHASQDTLHAALRHFAQHGLAAARHARVQAKAARHAGDKQSYLYWLDICRALDRRMAREIDSKAINT